MVEKFISIENISQRECKLINALRIKKYRVLNSLFIAEGEKVIEQLLNHFSIDLLVINDEINVSESGLVKCITHNKIRRASTKLMKDLSDLESRQRYIAIFKQRPTDEPADIGLLCVGLENIQDPGNMGTIIRLCDWLGIKTIFCSKGCVDIYSPKVIQASAGAIGNVTVYTDVNFCEKLPLYFDQIIGTCMSGSDYIEFSPIREPSIILFGNEGSGLTEQITLLCDQMVSIPPSKTTISESLNVSISAAIILNHFNRR